MAKYREEPAPGAPEWMLTFSDCMTLLLTFFVLLMSFSSFDDLDVFKKLKIIFKGEFPMLSTEAKTPRDAFLDAPSIHSQEQLKKGSERPTMERGRKDNLKKETFDNFHDRKVFIADSAQIFLGGGMMLSLNGKKYMSAMADFLKQMPNNVIVCEKSVKKTDADFAAGAERAWSIIDYLCKNEGMDYGKFLVSYQGTTSDISHEDNTSRVLEIVLLERGLAN